MTLNARYVNLARLRAPEHILVDEFYVDEVISIVKSAKFGSFPEVEADGPDKAGLVALCWNDGEEDRDPAAVIDKIRQLAPHLRDMVSPDHTVGVVARSRTGETGASVEMGGPAKPPEKTNESFPPRQDTDIAGRGVVVGVVDSGIVGHRWLDGSFLATPDSIDPIDENEDTRPDAQAGHGLFVTGLILREAPAAVVRVVRAFDMDGFVHIRRAANAIVELDQLGADVINLSFGGYTREDRPPLAHRKALSKLRDTTVVVAAAGNHDPEDEALVAQKARRFWPGAIERVVAVAALATVDGSATMAPFTNVGPWVDVAAPGADVVSTYASVAGFKGWAKWSGTSFAAPVVAGRIAASMTDESGMRVRSAQKAKEKVLEEARTTRPPGLSIGPDVVERIILPRDRRAAALVNAS